MWAIAEYHKKENPPVYEENYSTLRQETYLKYVYLITFTSLITAATATLTFWFPLAATAFLLISGILSGSASLFAFYFLHQSFSGDFPPDRNHQSYQYLLMQLDCSSLPESNTDAQEPRHFPPPLRNISTTQPVESEVPSECSNLVNPKLY